MCTRAGASGRDGYKAHVAIEPGTGLFTAGQLTRASGATLAFGGRGSAVAQAARLVT
jgi:hypothetical protein